MTVSATVETDADLADLSAKMQTEVVEAIRQATDEADAEPTAACRVIISADAEVVAEPPEGDSEEARA